MRQPRGDDFFIRIGNQHRHAEGEREVGEIFADHAIADDADGCAFELPAHARLRHAAGAIGLGGVGDMAAAIHHEADRHFGDRGGKAGRCLRDQDALRAGGVDVDVADVDGDAQEGDEVGSAGEEVRRARGLPVGDDNLAAARGLAQGAGVEHAAGVVEPHIAELAQRGKRALAVIIRQHVGRVGEQDRGHRGRLYQRRA